MQKNTTFSINLFFLFSFNVFGMSIEDELINREKSSSIKVEEIKTRNSSILANSDEIKRRALLLSCNPNWNGIYAFLDNKVYVSTISSISNSNSRMSISDATFTNGIIFSQKANIISWRVKDFEGGFSSGERWEFHVDSYKIYRKTMSDTIYKDTCIPINATSR
jgi:hypothetical protein